MCSVGLSSDKRRGSLGNLSIAFTASSPRARGLRNGRAARGLLVRKLPFLFNRFQRQFALRPRAGTALAWGQKGVAARPAGGPAHRQGSNSLICPPTLRKRRPVIKRLTTFGIIVLAVFLAGPAGAEGPPGGLDVNVVDTRTPVQVLETADQCNVPGGCSVSVFEVPEGKRLVIEYLSLETQLLSAAPGQSVQVRLNTQFNDQGQAIAVGTTTSQGTGANAHDIFAGPVKAYAQSGTSVRCDALSPNFESFFFAVCTITGYLEDEN